MDGWHKLPVIHWFNFGGDPEGILDSSSLWNFRYHCFQWGIREPLANRGWCCHLANNIALAEVCGLYDCFLVVSVFDLTCFALPLVIFNRCVDCIKNLRVFFYSFLICVFK